MAWAMLWLFLGLKIPLIALCVLVWWAIRQEPEPDAAPPEDDGDRRVRPHAPPPLPHAPRRGPHGEQALPAPPRVRPLNARARDTTPR
jgi:hypothetical protein